MSLVPRPGHRHTDVVTGTSAPRLLEQCTGRTAGIIAVGDGVCDGRRGRWGGPEEVGVPVGGEHNPRRRRYSLPASCEASAHGRGIQAVPEKPACACGRPPRPALVDDEQRRVTDAQPLQPCGRAQCNDERRTGPVIFRPGANGNLPLDPQRDGNQLVVCEISRSRVGAEQLDDRLHGTMRRREAVVAVSDDQQLCTPAGDSTHRVLVRVDAWVPLGSPASCDADRDGAVRTGGRRCGCLADVIATKEHDVTSVGGRGVGDAICISGHHGVMSSGDRSASSRVSRGAALAKLSASTSANYLKSRLLGFTDSDDAELRFHAATADKMLDLLGSMKGAAMKIGQLASFVDLDLPPEAQAMYHDVLADLRDSAPPADPAAIRQVVNEQYGAEPEEVFAAWDDDPLASASIGQVHRAELPDGTPVVAKVQYPGVAEAIESDMANAELFAPMARMISPNLRIKPLMDELRDRLIDEIDYQREAQYQAAFSERYDGHPFIAVPRVFPDYCRPRIIVSEYVEGASFDEMLRTSTEQQRQRYGEIIYRFVFGSLHRFRLFNGDPHPGNYLFPGDGSVVFLDFGSVKLFSSATRDAIRQQLRAVRAEDVDGLMALLDDAGFLPQRDRQVDEVKLMEWFRMFNRPILEDREWTYTPEFAREVIRSTTDPRAGYLDLLRRLNLPPDYLLLNRIQWGVNSILGRLRATANWYRIGNEFMAEGPPSTPLGTREAPFVAASPYRA